MVPHHWRLPPFHKSEPCNTLTPSPRTRAPGAELENPRFSSFTQLKGGGENGGPRAGERQSHRIPTSGTASLGWDGETAGAAAQGSSGESGKARPPVARSSPQHPAGTRPPAANSSPPRAAPRGLAPGPRRAPAAPGPRPLPGPRRAQRPPVPPARPPLTFLGSGFVARRACSFSTTWSADSAAIAVTGAASSPELGSRRVLGPQLRPPCGPGGDGSANGPFRASAGGRVGTGSGPAPAPDHAHNTSTVRPAPTPAAGHAPDTPSPEHGPPATPPGLVPLQRR